LGVGDGIGPEEVRQEVLGHARNVLVTGVVGRCTLSVPISKGCITDIQGETDSLPTSE
jgi:hypothetical protein